MKGHEEVWEDDGRVRYLDSGDGFMSVSTCPVFSKLTFYVFAVH